MNELKCKYCGKICKNLNSLKNHERLCKLNPNRSPINLTGIKAMHEANKKNGVWNKGLTKKTNLKIKEKGERLHKRYQLKELIPHVSPMLDSKVREKHKIRMQEVYKTRIPHSHSRSKHGYYKNIWFESSWELMFIVYCLENNIKFIRNNKQFTYDYNGSKKSYFPDFYLIDSDEYVEIKGLKTDKDIAKWSQFSKKLIVIDEKSIQFNQIKNYIIKKYTKNYYIEIMKNSN